MKKIFRTTYLSLFLFVMFSIVSYVYAGTTITTNKSTYNPGDTINVTVTVSGAATWNVYVVAEGPVSAGTITFLDTNTTLNNITESKSATFTANGVGTIRFYTTSDSTGIDGNTGGYTPVSASKSVSVVAATTTPTTPTTSTTPTTPVVTTKSTDSSLKALAVAEGAITPAFSKDVKAYTLNVATEITEVNVSATVNNSRATYTVVGNKDLKEGENLVTVTVKAENRNNYSLYN